MHDTEHHTFLFVEFGFIHVKCSDDGSGWKEQWQQTVFRPVQLIILKYSVFVGIEIVFCIGKGYLVNLGYIGRSDVAVGGVHEHCCILSVEA